MRAPLCSTNPEEPLTDAVFEDPHSFWNRMRDAHPIARIGDTGVHLVTSWALVTEALEREPDFSANLSGVLLRGPDGRPTSLEFPGIAPSAVIATADEPAHAVHRGLVQPRLAAGGVAALEAPVRRWTREALAPFLAAGGGDFVPIAEIIPARVVAHLLGLPDEDVSRFRVWAMMGGAMLAGDVSADQMVELAGETARMSEYLGQHLSAATPADDATAPILCALARGVASGRIERGEAIGITGVLFGAAGESTAALIATTLRRLASDPSLAEALRADPAQIPRFVEELVRLEPPFNFHYRLVRRACTLGGASLVPGDRLMLSWAAANRDPEIFEDPDLLRLDRRYPKQHLGFGRGSHFCIGAPLARLEARIVLEEVLAGTDAIAPAADEPAEYARSIFVRRLERLPLTIAHSDA